jgi:protein SCO1/2
VGAGAKAWLPAAAASAEHTKPVKKGLRAGYFPNVPMRTHEDKKIRFYDDVIHGDKTVVINFMYTVCTGKCPGTTGNLVELQELLGDRVGRDVFMWSITLDPENDTPKALREYAELFGVKPGWQFLTGEKNDIESLRQKLGFVDPDPTRDADRANHAGVIVYGNEAIDRWAACPAKAKPENIIDLIDWMNRSRPPLYHGLNRPRKFRS